MKGKAAFFAALILAPLFVSGQESAADVAKNGVKVGEMESKLLMKVEELTLHLIDMNKRLAA